MQGQRPRRNAPKSNYVQGVGQRDVVVGLQHHRCAVVQLGLQSKFRQSAGARGRDRIGLRQSGVSVVVKVDDVNMAEIRVPGG